MDKVQHSQGELLDLLAAAIDGIDGYESETGDLRYWDEEKISRARRIIDAAGNEPQRWRDAQDDRSDTPR
jgi:hypothetical protein